MATSPFGGSLTQPHYSGGSASFPIFTTTGNIQQQIVAIGGGGGAGRGTGNYGQYSGGGGAGYGKIATMATSANGGYGGYYPPQQIDPAAHQREVAKYDGIMEAYWYAILEGYDMPWLAGKGVFEQAKNFCMALRNPSPMTWIRFSEPPVNDEIELLINDTYVSPFADSFTLQRYQGLQQAQNAMSLSQIRSNIAAQAQAYGGLGQQQSGNSWGNGSAQAQSQSWLGQLSQKIFGGGP